MDAAAYDMISCRVFVIDVESKRYNDQLHLLFWRNKLIEEKIMIVFISTASVSCMSNWEVSIWLRLINDNV